jgi:hypothetical protein
VRNFVAGEKELPLVPARAHNPEKRKDKREAPEEN